MNINKLRHRITIERNAGTVNDGAGNKIPKWLPVATVWANVKPLRGEEIVIASQTGQQVTHLVTIRYRTNITKAKHRINFNGRILAIQSILNKDERNIELNINCRENASYEG